MIRRIALALIVAYFCGVVSFSSGPQNCICGTSPDHVRVFEVMQSEKFFPEPEVVEIVNSKGKEVIRVQADLIYRNGATKEVVLETSDAGRTWKEVPRQAKTTVTTLLIYRQSKENEFERSRDGGQTWERPRPHILGHTAINQRNHVESPSLSVSLAGIDPIDPTRIYGCIQQADETSSEGSKWSELPGIFVSDDAGDTWSLFSSELRGVSAQGFCTIGINPLNSKMMIAEGRDGIVASHDGGQTWKAVGQQAALQKPASLRGYSEWLKQSDSSGIHPQRKWPFEWTYLTLIQVEFDPRSQEIIYLLTNKGIYKTEDGTKTWCLLPTPTTELFEIVSLYLDPIRPARLFVSTHSKILVSEDEGCHFSVLFDWRFATGLK